ncbi:MAG: DUF1697 domain-containing protein [Rubrivivax sp.]
MPRFVVLLRGVNVGKGNRVPMAEFKTLLEDLGHTEVTTLLNSGNAVFSSAGRSTTRHAAAIAAALQHRLGVITPAVVKSAAELRTIIDANPMPPPEADQSRFLVAFAADAATLQALLPLQSLAEAPERFVVTDVAAFLHCPQGLLQSRVGEALLGKVGKTVTTRNWATVLKLHALAGGPRGPAA